MENKAEVECKEISKEMRLKNFVAEGEMDGLKFNISTCLNTGDTIISFDNGSTFSYSLRSMINHAIETEMNLKEK